MLACVQRTSGFLYMSPDEHPSNIPVVSVSCSVTVFKMICFNFIQPLNINDISSILDVSKLFRSKFVRLPQL